MAYFGGEVYSHCPVVSRNSLVSHYSVPVATVHDSNTMECYGLPWSAMDCPGVLWTALECYGLPWSADPCANGLPWSAFQMQRTAMDCGSDAMDCHGLPWSAFQMQRTAMDCGSDAMDCDSDAMDCDSW
jgi:hypothetical protein